MGFENVNVNDAAPDELRIEKQLKGIHCGPDSALIKTDAKEQTPGGVYLPMSVQAAVSTGVVVSIGEGGLDFAGHRIDPVAKVGDAILFGVLSRAFSVELDLGDGKQKYHLIDQDEILAVLEYDEEAGGTVAPDIIDVGVGV